MQDPNTDDRLTRLEEKFGYAEDLLEALNMLVAQQQQQIDWLRRELEELRRQRPADAPSAPRSLFDELPRHY
ncbi:MAG: SlyX family protein [Pseudomonadota bacterium]